MVKNKQQTSTRKKESHITINVPIELRKEFKALMAKEGKTTTEVINQFMREYINKRKHTNL